MSDLLKRIEGSKVQVGPAPQSGSGSLLDSVRPNDFGMVSDLDPADLRAIDEGKRPPKLNAFEKMSAFQRASQGANAAREAGATREQSRDVAAAGYQQVKDAPFEQARPERVASAVAVQLPEAIPDDDWATVQAEVQKQMEYKRSVGVSDMFAAAYDEMTLTGSLTRLLSDTWHDRRDFQPDPMFDSLEGREVWGARMPQEDLEWVADSSSAEERKWKLDRLEETRENYKALGAHGEFAATLTGLTAGILDLPGWVAGYGAGKAAQLARTAVQIGAVGRVGLGAAEGAAGNIALTAGIELAGDHVTPGDYFYAGAFGVAIGGTMGAMQRRASGAPVNQAADDLAVFTETLNESQLTGAMQYHAGVLDEAAAKLPAGYTAEELTAAAHQVYQERSNAFWQAGAQPLDEADRILPTFEHADLYAGKEELVGTLTKNLEGQFSDAAARKQVGDLWGFTPETLPDNAKRLLYTEKMLRIMDNQPVFDERKLQTLIGRFVAPIADSKMVAKFSMPQHLLARSDHPIHRWIAANLLESPTQNAGQRATAAVEHTVRQRGYDTFNTRYNDAYAAWRNQNGGSIVKDTLSQQKHYEQFNDLVYQARENRAAGIRGEEHPHVRAAADALDEGYTLLRKDQVSARTLGSELLPDNSIGYTPRYLNTRYIEENPLQREAIRKEIYEQLHTAWKDMPQGAKIAKDVSANYINRARIEGAGGAMTPAHISDPHAASNIRDALAEHVLSAADLERYMARVGRGGGKHTKGRLDLDINKELTLPDGTAFKMSDAFVKDNSQLFRTQARYVNGDVTLSRRGIMGKMGVDQLREMLVLSRKGESTKKWQNEMDAFDQTMAEFLGKPYGTAHRIADNFRILTTASRLGQAVMPQMAETAQIIAHLGTESAMRFVKDLPRLVKEVHSGKHSALLHSLELPGGVYGDTHRIVMPWQSFDDVQLAGKEAAGTIDRAIRGAAAAQYTLTGHRYLHAAQVRGVAEQILHKIMRYAKDGTNHSALTSAGMNDKLIAAIKADLKNVAAFDKDGALTSFDIRQTSDPAAMHELRQVIERGANQIIQGNFIGERQAFTHDAFLRILAQFRSYSLTAMSKQWTRTRVDQGSAKALGLLMGQMSFALPIHLARVMAVSATMDQARADKYRENNLRPDMLARATLNYTSLGGSAGDIFDAGMGIAGFEMSGVRGGSGDILKSVPALGYVSSTAQALKDKDMHGLIKALPGGNSVYLLPAANLTHWMQQE